MAAEIDDIYEFEGFVLDVSERQLSKNGEPISLTPKVFDVLAYFVERAGHLVEKEEVLQNVWPDSFVEEANISRVVHTLRRTLGDSSSGERLIQTVSKRGYRFTAKVTTRPITEVPAGIERPDANIQLRRGPIWAISAGLLCVFVLIAAGGFFLGGGRTQSLSFDGMVPTRVTSSGDVLGPAISPDGKFLLFIKGTDGMFGLQVRNQESGEIREIVRPRPGVRFWAVRFSHDGNNVYYIENKDNDLGTLYRISSSGGEPKKVADHSTGGAMVSPDGQHILFVRADKQAGTTEMLICDADGRNERVVTATNTDNIYMSVAWGSDAESILYVKRKSQSGKFEYSIVDRQIESGRETVLVGPSERSVISAFWLPQKAGLVINAVDETSKLPQIFFRSYPDGAESRITNDLSYYYHLSITADGKSIFTQKIEQDRYIWHVPEVSSSEATQLTFEKDQHFDAVDWLDRDTLVFDPDFNGSHRSRNLRTLDIGAKTSVPLTEGLDDNTIPRTAPGGEAITYISSKTGIKQLWRMNTDGSNRAQLTDIPHRVYEHSYSPDGRWIYVHYSVGGEGKLVRMPAAGGEMTEIGGREFFEWSLSPDGTQIAYRTLDAATGKFQINIRSVDDPKTLRVFPVELSNHLEWSKNGEFIYFVADKDLRKNIWRQPLAGGEPTRVTDFKDAEILAFAESPNGKSLALIRSTTAFDAVQFDFPK